MANLTARTTSNMPRLRNPTPVEEILDRYVLGLHVEVTPEGGFALYGHDWPVAARRGSAGDDQAPSLDEEVDESLFEDFLLDLAPHLREPLVVHAIGGEGLRWPLMACQWTIHPNAKRVLTRTFRPTYCAPREARFTLDGVSSWAGVHHSEIEGGVYPWFARAEAEAVLAWATRREGRWATDTDGRTLLHWPTGHEPEPHRYAPDRHDRYPIGSGEWPWRVQAGALAEACFEAHPF